MRLLIEFDEFEKEQSLVGRMLMAYGEFEFEVARLLGYAIPGGNDTAGRLLFRVNGEAARLDVADALLRSFFEKLKLGGQWGCAFGALWYCKDIRNQYAHCTWHSETGKPLTFMLMDKDADSPDGTLMVQLYPTDLPLLEKQHEYFEYTLDWLYYLGCECRKHLGEQAPALKAPKSIPQPPKHNRPKTPPGLPEAGTIPKERPGES